MSIRREKLTKLLKEEIAEILREAHDPRLAMAVITRLDLSKDGKHAKIYFTTIPEGVEKDVEKALNAAEGYIRSLLLRRLSLKFVPHLTFKFDVELKQLEKLWEKL
ncbi:ribosome-binding factor A [Hydrogenobacter thermophilus TK-6]|uniref:Ribosome-binding factor A n=1 Tax=Hydrogenobacter thermophilus (strain DSM 6534 / IAM 12695 / TK-6) TaxID=608538 RepID=D3DKK5_HYDTT|nr:30S ribosome-binding factor RbfA [Hydrogenobacter thermophilus]ADO46275.1 ribosome-binding factor A [Hydrogenobacter thermophilus TK-6]BAI70357.1 ribosome-binding factor A [Hydrogenobacter thermophilus TK-6]